MLKNYFKIAWRNLIKTKSYSFINIGGLAVGMAVAMLIGMWIFDELTFNKYHKNSSHIAQVFTRGSFNGHKSSSNSLPRPLEFELRNKYGNNFQHIVMSRYDDECILSVNEKKIKETGRFMQAGAPVMLSLKILKGSLNGLHDQSSIMLSSTTAKSLYGDSDPVGKLMKINNKMDVKVTAVFEDIPLNSEFNQVKFLAPWDLLMANEAWMNNAKDNWGNHSFLIYVQIKPNTTFATVSSRIKTAMADNAVEGDRKFNREVFLYPMNEWHLFDKWENGVNDGGRIQFVWLFGIIGCFVLLLACINFMNLSTARSEKRAREVGIRKAIGSVRSQLIGQFLSESFLVVVLAFFVSLLLVSFVLPLFNDIADKEMQMMWGNGYFWLASIIFILFTSIVSGSYPAFYLSAFNPVKVLKGTFQAGRFSSLPRQVLVVLQFSVSIALIIGTIIVYNQVQHAKNRPIGYDNNGLLMFRVSSANLIDKYEALEHELKKAEVVVEMSRSSSPLTGVWSNNGGLTWRNKDPNKVENFGTIYITHDYGKTVGWEFVAGRDFSKNIASDSVFGKGRVDVTYSMVINEAAAKYMDMENPVGELVHWDNAPIRIIGVIKDVVAEDPYQPVRQAAYLVKYDDALEWINMRINPELPVSVTLSTMESIFKKVVPDVPFDYKFADAEYGQKFSDEERIGKLSSIFAGLAIFISCLGLFGLASFVAEKRTKEIGIRKILGANLFTLWKMLSKDFIILVTIACLIAVPIAYYFLHNWLQNYQYRTEISWWIFAVSIFGALVITLLTVSVQAIKAGMSNPVKSLRSE